MCSSSGRCSARVLIHLQHLRPEHGSTQTTGPAGKNRGQGRGKAIRRGPAENDARGKAAGHGLYRSLQARRARAHQGHQPLLSHDQESRYKAELEKRAASRKQVVIDNLVAKLDGDLVLTSEQRTRLVEALSANWKDAWGQSLQMLMNIDSFFPNIPDQVVAPILTDNQKEVWRRIPKNSNVFWGFSFGGGIVENDPLDDPELAEAQKEAEARDKK